MIVASTLGVVAMGKEIEMKTVVLNVNDQVVYKISSESIDVFGLTKYQATPVDEPH